MTINIVKAPQKSGFSNSHSIVNGSLANGALVNRCGTGKSPGSARVFDSRLRFVKKQTVAARRLTFRVFALVSCLLLFSVPTISFADAQININSANADALSSVVNGIGPAKAAAIVAYRDMHGAFKTLDDILKVPGIGEVTLSRIKPFLALEDSSTKGSSEKDEVDRN